MAYAWDDLPNAKHIYRVLDRGRARMDEWAKARLDAQRPEWTAAWLESRKEIERLSRHSIWDEVWIVARGVGMGAIALVAWDDCAYILDLHPDGVTMLAGSGNHAAVLLLPAVLVLLNQGDHDGHTQA